MGIYLTYLYYQNLNYCRNTLKLQELEKNKHYLKIKYKINPSQKTYSDIIKINKQIDAIKLKSKKKGKSNLRYELNKEEFEEEFQEELKEKNKKIKI